MRGHCPGGTTYVTQRVLYTSPTRNRDQMHAKTIDVFHSDTVGQGWGATYVSVSNRPKPSGFVYPLENARMVRDRLILAYAVHDGTIEDLSTGLKGRLVELERTKPVAPVVTLRLLAGSGQRQRQGLSPSFATSYRRAAGVKTPVTRNTCPPTTVRHVTAGTAFFSKPGVSTTWVLSSR